MKEMAMNANTALLSTRRYRQLLMPALLGACATGCSIVFDADELAEGYGAGVEIIASQQCNPGRVLLADGYAYWTTNYKDAEKDEVCTGPESTAIRRLALGSTDEPQNIATKNLDGEMGLTHPWGFTVTGKDLYWVTEFHRVCTANVEGVDQGCSLPPLPSKPCKSYGIASAEEIIYFYSGTCNGGTETAIQGYSPNEQLPPDLKVTVKGFVVWIDVVPVDGPSENSAWLAWIDKCPVGGSNQMNVAMLPGPSAIWSRCTKSDKVYSGAIDADGVYWPDEATGTVDMLPLPGGVVANAEPTTLVTGLIEPGGVALDAKHVYVTSEDFGGSVLYLPRSATPPMLPLSAGDLGVVASDRKDAHGGKGVPFRIAAEDPAWLYWVVNEHGNAVERARKPD